MAPLFEVDEGTIEGVDVAGTTCAVVMQTPRHMLEGGFKTGLVIDDGATDGQAERLGQVFSGQLGGSMAGLSGFSNPYSWAVDKTWRHGEYAARVVGIGSNAYAFAPVFLPGLAPASTPPASCQWATWECDPGRRPPRGGG